VSKWNERFPEEVTDMWREQSVMLRQELHDTQQELERVKNIVGLLVLAAGGQVQIGDDLLRTPDAVELAVCRDAKEHRTIYKAFLRSA
jgi:hypothetical protein